MSAASGDGDVVVVTVDPDICQGHGQCVAWFPDLFEMDDDGIAHVVGPVSGSRRRDAEDAVQNCPARAIAVVDAT
jgi:ferredoxin